MSQSTADALREFARTGTLPLTAEQATMVADALDRQDPIKSADALRADEDRVLTDARAALLEADTFWSHTAPDGYKPFADLMWGFLCRIAPGFRIALQRLDGARQATSDAMLDEAFRLFAITCSKGGEEYSLDELEPKDRAILRDALREALSVFHAGSLPQG